jgi:metal-dependent amidase/aminoacylase/carboxypeptidase family protein
MRPPPKPNSCPTWADEILGTGNAGPEAGLDLPRTQQKVLAALDGLPLTITTGIGLTSVTGVLNSARPGPAVLLRRGDA